MDLMMKTKIRGGVAAEMFKTNHGYAVRYGLQAWTYTNLHEATKEYENCVRHAMSCAGYDIYEEA